jgi:predicted  nucleic acid-binding Zn-ribbon protein
MKGEALKQKLIKYQQKLSKFENDQNSLKQKHIYEKHDEKKQELEKDIYILEQQIGRLRTEIMYIETAIQSGKEYYPAYI